MHCSSAGTAKGDVLPPIDRNRSNSLMGVDGQPISPKLFSWPGSVTSPPSSRPLSTIPASRPSFRDYYPYLKDKSNFGRCSHYDRTPDLFKTLCKIRRKHFKSYGLCSASSKSSSQLTPSLPSSSGIRRYRTLPPLKSSLSSPHVYTTTEKKDALASINYAVRMRSNRLQQLERKEGSRESLPTPPRIPEITRSQRPSSSDDDVSTIELPSTPVRQSRSRPNETKKPGKSIERSTTVSIRKNGKPQPSTKKNTANSRRQPRRNSLPRTSKQGVAAIAGRGALRRPQANDLPKPTKAKTPSMLSGDRLNRRRRSKSHEALNFVAIAR
ncbi:hypothetical protein FHG87_003547 [Trinorchestia longiramus]|nr:hypothetical protein FHG87_003547 [Trinorchestia longiramus]